MPQIRFVPNDPGAAGAPTRSIAPPATPAGSAAVTVSGAAPAGLYPPHTSAFDHWQAQTALIRGLRRWRDLDGSYLARWQGKRSTLPVNTDAGDDLNAFYDRRGLQFFTHTYAGVTVHACESPDVVNHEQGHALLDAVRPDFWDAPFAEVAAFHESFGDCYALLVALADPALRAAALAQSPDLSRQNLLSRLAEELGAAVRREYGAAAADPDALRRALNRFRWADPSTLPADAPSSRLSGEPHSFSRVFTGCLWDTIRFAFAAGPRTANALGTVATAVGVRWLAAIRSVPLTARLFAGVGQRMLQADLQQHAGALAPHIRRAFAGHGIALAAAVQSLPMPLAAPRRLAAARPAVAALLGERAAATHFTVVETPMHGTVAHVAAWRPLALSGRGLAGLHVLVPATARLVLRGTAILGSIGDPAPVDEHVERHARAFAQGLVANGQLEGVAGRRERRPPRATHRVAVRSGKRVIVRLGFACGCCAG
jgi:hypothetical protein